MRKDIFPNTFLIGIQKAGTTTLDDWLNQHPEIFCYTAIKDFNLFDRFGTEKKIEKILLQQFTDYRNQKIILHSAVNYILYPQSMAGIAQYSPDAKLLVILRNPVDRAISAYNYFKKRFDEKRPPYTALLYDPKDDIGDYSITNNDFTYIEHGLYYRQIVNCLKYFDREQLLILEYDELASNPVGLSEKIFSFLTIDKTFRPDFSVKNVTSDTPKNIFLQKLLWQQSSTKKWIVNNLLFFWLPPSKRIQLKMKLRELNEKGKKPPDTSVAEKREDFTEIKKSLQKYFEEDVINLDKLLGTNYFKKWFKNER